MYDGIDIDRDKIPKELELEIARLKRLVADTWICATG
jgi:hypothetical protein